MNVSYILALDFEVPIIPLVEKSLSSILAKEFLRVGSMYKETVYSSRFDLDLNYHQMGD